MDVDHQVLGRRVQRRGARFELELAHELAAALGPLVGARRGRQVDGATEPDVIVSGALSPLVGAVWFELHHGSTSILAKLRQAERDAARAGGARLPVVVRRVVRGSTLASMHRETAAALGLDGEAHGDLVSVAWPALVAKLVELEQHARAWRDDGAAVVW